MAPDRLAVYSTVYPGVEPFLADWHASLLAQTDGDFELWLGADALAPRAVDAAAGGRVRARWVRARPGDTPGALRGRAIARLTQPARRVGGVVFVDADDVLEPTRVAAARAALAERDVDACALRYVDARGRPLGGLLAPAAGEDAAAALPRHNVYGLSNSAYRAAVLRRCLPVPPGCALVDWLLATRAWLLGASLGFDPCPRMRYRQHAANLAPARRPVSAASVAAAAAHALAHYGHVLDAPWPARADADPARVAQVGDACDRARRFRRAVVADAGRLAAYADALNRLPDDRVPRAWWWAVAHPDLAASWETPPEASWTT